MSHPRQRGQAPHVVGVGRLRLLSLLPLPLPLLLLRRLLLEYTRGGGC
jgi:hypothetical protein